MRRDFAEAVKKIKALKNHKRYLGAYIFGSLARGEETDESDIDVKVIVDKSDCQNINHPFINNKKLDITFMTLKQQEVLLKRTVEKGDRIPMLVESIILFDKTGELKKLKAKFSRIRAKKYKKADFLAVQFLIFHADSKIARALRKKDFNSAELGMHLNLKDILRAHYNIKGKWWVSDKRIFTHLNIWDKKLSKLLAAYLGEKNIQQKYSMWSKMLNYILKPIGGRKGVEDLNCTCAECREHIAYLLKS